MHIHGVVNQIFSHFDAKIQWSSWKILTYSSETHGSLYVPVYTSGISTILTDQSTLGKISGDLAIWIDFIYSQPTVSQHEWG